MNVRNNGKALDYTHIRVIVNLLLSRCLFHQSDEALEVVRGIVRPRRGFGVVLDGEDWQALVAHALDAVVVEIEVRHFHVRREAVGGDGETVIV